MIETDDAPDEETNDAPEDDGSQKSNDYAGKPYLVRGRSYIALSVITDLLVFRQHIFPDKYDFQFKER